MALRALGLGDLLTAVPALRGLARSFPDHHLVLAVPAWLRALAELTHTVDEVVDVVALAPLPERLHHADVAVNLHGRGPESSALLAASGPRRLVAHQHVDVAATADGPVWDETEHEVHRWCRLLTESAIAADSADFRIEPPTSRLPVASDTTIVHPGAAVAAKRWPVERWAAVARAEADAGHPVVVTGSAAERDLAVEVARAAGLGDEAVAAGSTDLVELASLVARAGRLASGDTGIAHLASALGTPSVVLFGPVSPARWGPPEDGPHVALWTGVESDPFAQAISPALFDLGIEAVVDALASLPGRRAHAAARARAVRRTWR